MTDKRKILITLTGPTACGKSTLERALRSGGSFGTVRSFTTRAPREGEVDGVHYDFVTEDQVDAWSDRGEISEVVSFPGGTYGSTVHQVDAAFAEGNGVAVIVVEPFGAEQFARTCAEKGWQHFAVYIDAPLKLAVQRFLDRFRNDPKADTAKYCERLFNLIYHEVPNWPSMFDWTYRIPGCDDRKPGRSTADYARRIVDFVHNMQAVPKAA